MNSRERAASHALLRPLTDGTYGRMADKSPFSGGGDAVLAGSPCLSGGVAPKLRQTWLEFHPETERDRRQPKAPDGSAESHPTPLLGAPLLEPSMEAAVSCQKQRSAKFRQAARRRLAKQGLANPNLAPSDARLPRIGDRMAAVLFRELGAEPQSDPSR